MKPKQFVEIAGCILLCLALLLLSALAAGLAVRVFAWAAGI